MTSVIQNDVSGKTIATNDSVKVQIYLRGSKVRKDFDCGMADVRKLLSAKGVVKIPYYKLQKASDGSWNRLSVDDPEQEKLNDSQSDE